MKELWVEKYRPKKLNEYVFSDTEQKRQCQRWIADGAIPHLVLTGSPGVGKTTMAKMLFHELNVQRGDVLEVNASQESSVEHVRDKIVGFVSTIPIGDFKYVLLDEADYLSPTAQGTLRGVMERYSMTARFVLTANYENRIIPAIKSRCETIHIERLDMESFILRLIKILQTESVEIDGDILDTYIKHGYPDLRRTINTVQGRIENGVLLAPRLAAKADSSDYKLKMIELFKQGKIIDGRNLIVSQIRQDEYEDMFRFLYQNVSLFGSTETQQNMSIIKIREGLVKHSLCADPEINLAATLTELAIIHQEAGE